MHVATGYIRRIGLLGSSKFMATFPIGDAQYTFAGVFATRVPDFSCRTARITYTSMSQFTSTRLVEGTIGPNSVKLRVFNGPVIDGPLEAPYDPPCLEVVGCGVWFQS